MTNKISFATGVTEIPFAQLIGFRIVDAYETETKILVHDSSGTHDGGSGEVTIVTLENDFGVACELYIFDDDTVELSEFHSANKDKDEE